MSPTLPLAHFGHWYVGLIYLLPVAAIVISLLAVSYRDRRAEAREADTPTIKDDEEV